MCFERFFAYSFTVWLSFRSTLFFNGSACFFNNRGTKIIIPKMNSLITCCLPLHVGRWNSHIKSQRQKKMVYDSGDRYYIPTPHPQRYRCVTTGTKMRFLRASQEQTQALRLPRTLCRSLLANMFLCTIQKPFWALHR